MATILEIARHAGVPADQVLRVVSGEPVSQETARRVRESIALLGAPPYPPPRRDGAAAAVARSPLPAPREPEASLVERIADATADLEARLPNRVGSVVYEAVWIEVRRVAEQMAAMDVLFREVLDGLRRLAAEVAAERRERVDDLALQVDLVRTSWTSVDRRLGRLERIVERQAKQSRDPGAGEARVLRLDGGEEAPD